MTRQKEINRGYVDYLRVINAPGAQESAPPAPPPSAPCPPLLVRWALAVDASLRRLARLPRFVRFLSHFTVLSLTACAVLAYLKVRAWFRFSRHRSELHEDALGHVDSFIQQYPFHFYPLLLKCLELAFLRRSLAKAVRPGTRVVELAIGDGTLSSKVYPAGTRVVALDLTPYSLRNSARMPHVRQAIVADCLAPPLADGSFDLLVANNFLHHVSAKDEMLAQMARVARRVMFNEDTPYWASAWPYPFVLRKLGLKRLADRAVARIQEEFLQDLEPREVIDELTAKHFRILTSESYFHEFTYFLCGLFSRLMGCYGPPTPPALKTFLLGRRLVRGITLGLTRALARALLAFDAHQSPADAVFVSYYCESLVAPAEGPKVALICPDCRTALEAPPRCPDCGRHFDCVDGMQFILPTELEFIRRQYLPETSAYEGVSQQEHH